MTVILCTHNPAPDVLSRTLAGLRAQTFASERWELLIVDNGSAQPVTALDVDFPAQARVLNEPRLGLTHARLAGLRATSSPLIVFVDDDNVLAPDYLERAVEALQRLPSVGAAGGKSLPDFASPPAEWQHEFVSLLAVRDLGAGEQLASAGHPLRYPGCSPIGAGMVLRCEALNLWLRSGDASIPDRTGSNLSSGGDNDIVLHVLRSGWSVAYIPGLVLHHIIPARRLQPDYLARLNRAMQRSWMEVLTRHDANPWHPIPRWSLPLRVTKAWLRHAPWSSEANRIRFCGALGHFEGRCAPASLLRRSSN